MDLKSSSLKRWELQELDNSQLRILDSRVEGKKGRESSALEMSLKGSLSRLPEPSYVIHGRGII